MAAFAEVSWLMPRIGVVEIIVGALFIFLKTRALGAIVILPAMVGIVIHNFVKMPEAIATALVFAGVNLWILIDNRKKYEIFISRKL